MGDELIDICDEKNNLTRIQKMKSEAHKKGLWHRAAHIAIYNFKGEILLQLRDKDKELYPDMWDISAAGHVSAGEKSIGSAVRETNEEIGLSIGKRDLKFFKIIKEKVIYRDIKNNEFDYVYFLEFNGDIKQLKLQDEEVQKIDFFSLERLEKELKENPEKFVPHNYWFEIINEVRDKLDSEIKD